MKRVMLFLIVCSLFGSCKKYPEDDLWFHLRKPYDRITRCRWKIDSYKKLYSSSYEPSCLTSDWGCVFKKDGTSGGGCNGQNGPLHPITSYQYNLEGTWKLIEGDKKIQIVNDATHTATWEILQLDRKHMKIKGDSVEFTCTSNGPI